MKQSVLLFLMAAGMFGCKELGLKDEKFDHQVPDVGKEHYFVIENKKQPASASFSIEGELSHDAKILWSGSEPVADTASSSSNEILLPKGKVKIVDDQRDYYGKKLYVKYVSLNDSTTGNLQIKIKL
jgi:hypothetical protein